MKWKNYILLVGMLIWIGLMTMIAVSHRGGRKVDADDGRQKRVADADPKNKVQATDDGNPLLSLCDEVSTLKVRQRLAEDADRNQIKADKLRTDRELLISSYSGKALRVRCEAPIGSISKDGKVYVSAGAVSINGQKAIVGHEQPSGRPHLSDIKVVVYTANGFDLSGRPEWLAVAKAGDPVVMTGTIDSVEVRFETASVVELVAHLKDAKLEPK